jgi:hypothetical protein
MISILAYTKNEKQQGINVHENTLYYEKRQTTNFVFFYLLLSTTAV